MCISIVLEQLFPLWLEEVFNATQEEFDVTLSKKPDICVPAFVVEYPVYTRDRIGR